MQIPGTEPAAGAAADRRALVGAVLIVVLLTLSLVIFFLDPIQRKVARVYTVTAVLPGAHRIQDGTVVRLAGSAVGHVTSVALLPVSLNGPGQVALRLQIRQGLRPYIRKDSRVHIHSVTPLGPPVVDIAPGTPGAPMLAAGDTLRPAPSTPLSRAVDAGRALGAALDSLGPPARVVLRRARLRRRQLQALERRLNAIRRDLDTLRARGARGSLAAFFHDSSLARSMVAAAGNVHDVATDLERRRAHLDTLRVNVSKGLRPPLADTGVAAGTLARLRRTARRLNRLTARIEAGSGSLPRLGRDRALLQALRGAQAQIDSLTAALRHDPLYFLR